MRRAVTILSIPGVANIRDVGGMPASGGRVREGVLLRSAQLARLTSDGDALLRQRVTHVIDLRDDAEVTAEPSALTAVRTTRVPMFVGSAASFFFTGDLSLAAMYRHMVSESTDRLVSAIRHLAEGEPTLVHCTAGKDRTGVTVALALSAVGADRDAVIDDYALTASQLPAARTKAIEEYVRTHMPQARHAVELATASPAPVMAQLLDEIDREHGSVVRFLRASGLSDGELERLRATLIE